jgi:quinol monooxygenase YgiN
MTILDPAANHLVLINTFTVDPSKCDELLKVLADATHDVMRYMPGFVSANLHVSADQRHVANYAQWCSLEDLQAMMKDPAAQSHMKVAASLADGFEPHTYNLRHSISAEPLA